MRRGALIGALLLIGVGVVPIFTCRSYTGSRIEDASAGGPRLIRTVGGDVGRFVLHGVDGACRRRRWFSTERH